MSGASYGQSDRTELGNGIFVTGDGPAVNDPFTPANRASVLRAELALIDTQLRNLQQRHAAVTAQLARLEDEAA
jgi:hypothetical protein